MKPMCLMMRLFSKAAACPVTEVVTGPGVEAGDPLPLPLGLLGFRSPWAFALSQAQRFCVPCDLGYTTSLLWDGFLRCRMGVQKLSSQAVGKNYKSDIRCKPSSIEHSRVS